MVFAKSSSSSNNNPLLLLSWSVEHNLCVWTNRIISFRFESNRTESNRRYRVHHFEIIQYLLINSIKVSLALCWQNRKPSYLSFSWSGISISRMDYYWASVLYVRVMICEQAYPPLARWSPPPPACRRRCATCTQRLYWYPRFWSICPRGSSWNHSYYHR